MKATQYQKGTYRVVDVEYNKKGKSTVTPITGWLPIPEWLKQPTTTTLQILAWNRGILAEYGQVFA